MQITNADSLEAAAIQLGLLPFFKSPVAGLSMEEMTPRDHWFADGIEGAWEWRMTVAGRGNAIYGKFFHGRAGFIARRFMPDFCNLRRQGYDFDTRYELGLADEKCARLVRLLEENGPLLSGELRKASALGSSFDSAITRLMMQGYAAVLRFEFPKDKQGKPFGWGTARYALLDQILGDDFTRSRYDLDPDESLLALARENSALAPGAVRLLLSGKEKKA